MATWQLLQTAFEETLKRADGEGIRKAMEDLERTLKAYKELVASMRLDRAWDRAETTLLAARTINQELHLMESFGAKKFDPITLTSLRASTRCRLQEIKRMNMTQEMLAPPLVKRMQAALQLKTL